MIKVQLNEKKGGSLFKNGKLGTNLLLPNLNKNLNEEYG